MPLVNFADVSREPAAARADQQSVRSPCSSATLRSDPKRMGHSGTGGYEAEHASRSASLHRVQISNQVATQFYTTSPASANEWCVARTCASHHNSNKPASRHTDMVLSSALWVTPIATASVSRIGGTDERGLYCNAQKRNGGSTGGRTCGWQSSPLPARHMSRVRSRIPHFPPVSTSLPPSSRRRRPGRLRTHPPQIRYIRLRQAAARTVRR